MRLDILGSNDPPDVLTHKAYGFSLGDAWEHGDVVQFIDRVLEGAPMHQRSAVYVDHQQAAAWFDVLRGETLFELEALEGAVPPRPRNADNGVAPRKS